MNLKWTRRHIVRTALSVVCIQLMLLSAVMPFAPAQEQDNDLPTMPVYSSMDMENIIIPDELGKIDDSHEGLEDTLIVHIQDVHCNYEAQKNIADMLKVLAQRNDIRLVGVEGAGGPFMIDKFHVLQNKKVREKIADYFMKTGKFAGSEYLAFTGEVPVKLYGVEELQSYMDNFRAFQEPLKFQKEFEEYYQNVQEIITQLKDKTYTPQLKELDDKTQQLEKAKITLVEFCNYLKDILIEKNFILKDYKNFARLITLKHLEKGIDFDNVNREKTGLLNFMGPRLSKDEILELRAVSVDFSKERITSDDYYKYLKQLADSKDLDISRFPNIAFYFKYLELYRQLDLGLLMNEKQKLVAILKEKLFTTPDQRIIDEISESLSLVRKLFALRVSHEEFDRYNMIKDGLSETRIENQLTEIANKYGVSSTITKRFKFESEFDVMDNFYRLAEKRNHDMLNNTLSFMKEEDSNTAVLISGGFHTTGMTETMRQNDISYLIISPSITQEHDYSLYLQNMTGDEDAIDQLFSIQLPGSAAIPPPSGTTQMPFDPARAQMIINSAVLYDIALELADVINEKIDLTTKKRLNPTDQKIVLEGIGGNEYLRKISETLNVSNLVIDFEHIEAEGANNAILVIPVKLFDLTFKIAVVHPSYDLDKAPSRLISDLNMQGIPKKDIPELNITIYFEGTDINDLNLLYQDPFMPLIQQKLPPSAVPALVPDLAQTLNDALDSNIPPDQIGPKVKTDETTGKPVGRITDYEQKGKGDSLVVFNVHGEEILGLTRAFGDTDFDGFEPLKDLDVALYTMTRYSPELDALPAFPRITNEQSLGQVLADNKIRQSRIAGSDTITNVTIALDGNVKVAYAPDQYTVVEVAQPPRETLTDKPSYNSGPVADEAIRRIKESDDNLIVASFSTPDVLGQTGDMVNTAKGIDEMDQEIARLIEKAQEAGVTVLLTGTHGNVESMLDKNGKPVRGRYLSYTNNPVPFVYMDARDKRLKTNKDVLQADVTLASVAPAILDILGIEKPKSMTAPSIFKNFTPQKNERVLLLTIDGLGISPEVKGNALELARAQLARQGRQLNLDKWMAQYPSTELIASGEQIGLRKNSPGYPQANYFVMGSGLAPDDIVLDMVQIDRSIDDNSFYRNPAFNNAVDNALRNGTKLHLLGLVSQAEVDSSVKHLEALLKLAKEKGMKKEDVIIHAITDGLDETPVSIIENIHRVTALTEEMGIGVLATAGGRYWFMNQDKENNKIEQAYKALVEKKLQEEIQEVSGVVILPDEILENSLGLRQALAVVRQQYGPKIKIGVTTKRSKNVMERILQVNHVADKVDFVVSEQAFGKIDPAIGLIDPLLNYVTARYPDITEPHKQVAIITLDLDHLGPAAPSKAQVFVQEQPQSDNEVFSIANGLFAAVMVIEGHENELAEYDGWVEGQPRTLRTITV